LLKKEVFSIEIHGQRGFRGNAAYKSR